MRREEERGGRGGGGGRKNGGERREAKDLDCEGLKRVGRLPRCNC